MGPAWAGPPTTGRARGRRASETGGLASSESRDRLRLSENLTRSGPYTTDIYDEIGSVSDMTRSDPYQICSDSTRIGVPR